MTIIITTDRNPEGWGADCDEETAAKAAWRLADIVAEYAREAYPEAEVHTCTDYWASGESTRVIGVVDASDEEADEVVTYLSQLSEDNWEAALGAVL